MWNTFLIALGVTAVLFPALMFAFGPMDDDDFYAPLIIFGAPMFLVGIWLLLLQVPKYADRVSQRHE
jgi:peptidoglycan/LPS O-acetylase OafA/YrhL